MYASWFLNIIFLVDNYVFSVVFSSFHEFPILISIVLISVLSSLAKIMGLSWNYKLQKNFHGKE